MLWTLRAGFALVLILMGSWVTSEFWRQTWPDQSAPWWWGSLAGLLIAGVFVLIEVAFTRRFLSIMSVIMFGFVFGFIASYIFVQTLFLLPVWASAEPWFKEWVQYASMVVFVYLAVIGILSSKEDFKFVIPFVELKREHSGPKPMILDTSVIIDGRVADLVDLHIITTKVILPRFVLQELQLIADSPDKEKRNRGRRGLDVLNRIQKSRGAMIEIFDGEVPGIEGVDSKLVALAKHMDGRLVTNDFNLNKVSQLQGVEVVNLHDLASAMRPVILPDDDLEVRIQKPGDEHGQGVGFLEDGTMVVVQGGFHRIGQTVQIKVTNVTQTSAGRMVFARVKGDSKVPSSGESGRRPQGSGFHRGSSGFNRGVSGRAPGSGFTPGAKPGEPSAPTPNPAAEPKPAVPQEAPKGPPPS